MIRLYIIGLVGFLIAMLVSALPADACGSKRYCKEMRNCAEASYYLEQCGLGRLDRDKDGIPCESKCGKSQTTYKRRVAAQTGGKGITLFAPSTGTTVSLTAQTPQQAGETFSCGNKRYCKQMNSCAEAKFYLAKCGARQLDGNRDGIPCNNLCR